MTTLNATLPAEPSAPSSLDWTAALVEHGRWLRTVVSARLGERQAVDEVMQEISLAAVEQRTPLADPTKVGAWLYRLAVVKVLLYRRQSGRRAKLFGRYADRVRAAGPDEPEPIGWLLSAERAGLVRRTIAGLPGREAEILLLKYSEGWTYRGLAEHLGQTESAVVSRLHRARLRLREALSRHPDFAPDGP